jgi:hypothetical protein
MCLAAVAAGARNDTLGPPADLVTGYHPRRTRGTSPAGVWTAPSAHGASILPRVFATIWIATGPQQFVAVGGS